MMGLLGQAASAGARGARPAVSVVWQGQTYVGRIWSQQEKHLWLQLRDGQLVSMPIAAVTSSRPESTFRPVSFIEQREALEQAFPRQYEVQGADPYLVVAPRGKGQGAALRLQRLYRQLITNLTRQGFMVHAAEFPLIVIVWPDRQAFEAACRHDTVAISRELRGYYHPATNRIHTYWHQEQIAGEPLWDNVLLHEGIHQIAFNIGLHARTQPPPLWLIEGLATALEREALRERTPHQSPLARINPERYARLQSLLEQPESLWLQILQQDDPFQQHPLDAYAVAWGWTFYLWERRSYEFSRYVAHLQTLERRTDSAAERLNSFQRFLGPASLLIQDCRRFYRELERERQLVTAQER